MSSDYIQLSKGVRLGNNTYCIADELINEGINFRNRKPCGSSDAMAVYEHEEEFDDGTQIYSAHCFSCNQNFSHNELARSSLADALGIEENELKSGNNKSQKENVMENDKTVSKGFSTKGGVVPKGKVVPKERAAPDFSSKHEQKPLITTTEIMGLHKKTTYNPIESNKALYRGIDEETYEFYGVRLEKDVKGNVVRCYYPETVEGKPAGYKCRTHPKIFGRSNLGRTGGMNELFGAFRFTEGGKYVLIVGGEHDALAAQQMLNTYNRSKGNEGFGRYAVVSPTTGESSCKKQIQAAYEWLNTFDNIIVGFDTDDVGREANTEIASILPKEKTRIATWTAGKDPNEMLLKGKSRQFISDFFNAKEVVESGIVVSDEALYSNVIEGLKRPRLSLPPFMQKITECTKGEGLIRNRIYNLYGNTSVGKTSIVNTLTHHWIMNETNAKVGVVSLEATAAEYTIDLLSYHLGKNLYWMPEEDAIAYLEREDVKEEANKMLLDEDGLPRFAILDDREGTWHSIKRKIEQLHKQHCCSIIIIDVLTDLLRVMNIEEQADALNYMANFVKGGVTLFNVLHTRKEPSNRGQVPTKPSEYDVYGSSIFVQKAAGNIGIYRNKTLTNDTIEQNTTYVDVPKMRQGNTGDKIMALYYDGNSRSFYDRDAFFKENPDKLPAGYDLSVSSYDKAYYQEGGRGEGLIDVGGNSNGGKGKKKTFVKDTNDMMDGVDF